MSILLELELVQRFLDQSNKYSLSAECLVTAIQLVRDNPTAELKDVLDQALASWDIEPSPNEEWLEEYGPYE